MQGQYYIYRYIRNDTNVPFYIGRGKVHYKNAQGYTNYSLRSIYGRAYSSDRNKTCKSIIEKYGHEVEIMYHADTIEEADKKEKEFISLYGSVYDGTGTLVNLTKGGSDFIPTREMIERHKNRYRENRSKTKLCKRLYMYSLDGAFIEEFDMLKGFFEKYGIGDKVGQGIGDSIRKKTSYKGFFFSFEKYQTLDVSKYTKTRWDNTPVYMYNSKTGVTETFKSIKHLCKATGWCTITVSKRINKMIDFKGFYFKNVSPIEIKCNLK